METKTVTVPNVGCNGCVNSIKLEVSDIPGVSSVEGVAETKQITVAWQSPATWEQIKAKMAEINYAPAH
ncbi:MAG: heavy-metal-associated domain-containing protein [Anaerolineae bacterium]|nr:heavy-metal-associated domain-containing protein [Anaerolineae bacterium]